MKIYRFLKSEYKNDDGSIGELRFCVAGEQFVNKLIDKGIIKVTAKYYDITAENFSNLDLTALTNHAPFVHYDELLPKHISSFNWRWNVSLEDNKANNEAFVKFIETYKGREIKVIYRKEF